MKKLTLYLVALLSMGKLAWGMDSEPHSRQDYIQLLDCRGSNSQDQNPTICACGKTFHPTANFCGYCGARRNAIRDSIACIPQPPPARCKVRRSSAAHTPKPPLAGKPELPVVFCPQYKGLVCVPLGKNSCAKCGDQLSTSEIEYVAPDVAKAPPPAPPKIPLPR